MGAAPARRPPARRAQGGLAPRRIPMPLPPRPPAPRVRPPLPAKRQPTGALVLDKLLHGRGWIGLVCVLLAGIVVFNVNLLQMNRDIAHTSDRAAGVKRENARLRADVARLASSERIQRVAAEAGLVMPAPGEVRYLRSKPRADARRAAERLRQGKLSGPPVAPVVPSGQAEVEAPSTTQPGPPGTGATVPPPTGASAPTAPMQAPAASPQPAP